MANEQEEFEFRARAEAESQNPSLMDRAKSAYQSYRQSPLYQASPQGMLETADKLTTKGFNKVGEMAANKIATTTNPFTKQPFTPNTAAAVGTGIQMIPDTFKSLAGPVSEGMAAKNPFQGIKATGPFTAGLKAPSTALPGSFESAGTELSGAKALARQGEDLKDAARLRALLAGGPAKIQKLAEEGKAAIESGQDIPVTRLLAYRDALGKTQAEGGTFAGDYKAAKDAATELLRSKAPDLVNKLEKMSLNFLARGNPSRTFPWFTFALDPAVGAVKSMTLPVVRNTAGAITSKLSQAPVGMATLGNLLRKKLSSNQ